MTQNLIQRALSGDKPAQEDLFYQHYPTTLRLALGLLGDEGDAEEVTQDTLAYALTHLDRYDPARAGFATWLYAIALNRCRSKRRRKWLPTIRLAEWLGQRNEDRHFERDPGPSPEECAERHERDAKLRTAVTQLSPKLREAIALRYAADLTYPQMAEVLGCSASAAQSRTWLGEQKLCELLSGLPADATTQPEVNNLHQLEMIK